MLILIYLSLSVIVIGDKYVYSSLVTYDNDPI